MEKTMEHERGTTMLDVAWVSTRLASPVIEDTRSLKAIFPCRMEGQMENSTENQLENKMDTRFAQYSNYFLPITLHVVT